MNSLEKKLIAAISAVTLLLLAVGIIAFKALNDSIEISQQVSNSRETLTEVEATLLTLKDAETYQRHFLEGRASSLEHFHLTREETKRKLAHLRSLTARNPRHQERLAKLEPAIHKKLNRMNEAVSIRKMAEVSDAKGAALSDEEIQEMDNISELLGEIRTEEQGTLQNKLADSNASVMNVGLSFGGLFVLILFLLLLVFFLVKRDLATQRQLQQRLEELASVDELTTLYNRREINRRFADETERSRRYGQPLSLLLLDVDHFKSINDKHGHPVGDEVLRHVAARIRDVIRSIDIAGRFGGEEFAVILPNTAGNDAFVIAERVRRSISEKPIELAEDTNATQIPITISIGISSLDSGESDEDVYRTADTALYQAKNEGRDRTILFEQLGAVH